MAACRCISKKNRKTEASQVHTTGHDVLFHLFPQCLFPYKVACGSIILAYLSISLSFIFLSLSLICSNDSISERDCLKAATKK